VGCWIARVEWGCKSSEEQTENRKGTEETHMWVEEFFAHKGNKKELENSKIDPKTKLAHSYRLILVPVIQGGILKVPYVQGSEHVFSGVGVHITRASAAIPYEITMKLDRASARRSHQDTVNAVLHDQSTGEVR
jgi:hypothetical protein